jgi:hypothetical protein
MQKVCRRYVFIYTYSFLIITTLRVVVAVFFLSSFVSNLGTSLTYKQPF